MWQCSLFRQWFYFKLIYVSDSSLLSGQQYGDGNWPILLSSLHCNREQNLLECRRTNYHVIGYHSCYSNTNTVALRCDGKYARKKTRSQECKPSAIVKNLKKLQ